MHSKNPGHQMERLHYKRESQNSSRTTASVLNHNVSVVWAGWDMSQDFRPKDLPTEFFNGTRRDRGGGDDQRWIGARRSTGTSRWWTGDGATHWGWLLTEPAGALWLPYASHDVGTTKRKTKIQQSIYAYNQNKTTVRYTIAIHHAEGLGLLHILCSLFYGLNANLLLYVSPPSSAVICLL